jgi:hypothetical protein
LAIGNKLSRGGDCGFGIFVGWEWVTEDVVRAKLKTIAPMRGHRIDTPLGQKGRLTRKFSGHDRDGISERRHLQYRRARTWDRVSAIPHIFSISSRAIADSGSTWPP